jgi:glyoxylase-like metal-dependent hydrolase (beta-lactamase superfamily II)
MATKYALPKPAPNQALVKLTLMPSGTINLPLWMFLSSVTDKSLYKACPSMSWLIQHPSEKRILFDLGLPKDKEALTPAVQKRTEFIKIKVDHDTYDGLEALDIDPKTDIDAIIFSHIHWDHVGDPRGFGQQTKFVVGPGATTLLSAPTGFPENQEGHFKTALFSTDRTHQIPEPKDNNWFWQKLGPFEAAHDYFKDGSLWIVNAPGHLAGHINLLVRTEKGWIYLAGDTCHFAQLLDGDDEAAIYDDPERPGFMKNAHAELELAEEHMERVMKLKEQGVEVVLAHDGEWLEKNGRKYR